MTRRDALEDFVERARGSARLETLDAAAAEALSAFEQRGLDGLVLKGPALASALYRDGEHRAYSDIDVLVRPGDLDGARGALAELGYRRSAEDRGIDDVAGVLHAETWTRPTIGFRGGPVLIDLHWRLAGCEAADETIWAALAGTRRRLELHDREVWVPGRSGLAFHLAIHAAQHGPDDVKAMGDLDRGIDRWPLAVWEEAERLARETEGVAAFAAGLRLSAHGARLAERLGLPGTEILDWELRNRAARPRGTYHLEALAQAGGIRGRLDILRRSLLPTRNWIEWEHPWARGSRPRLVVAYLLHIVRSPRWAIRAWRYRRARETRAG